MAQYEIERRFLVDKSAFMLFIENRNHHLVEEIDQAYLYFGDSFLVRYRMTDTESFITIKGKHENGACEEYEIPVLLHPHVVRGLPKILKTRHSIPWYGLMIYVDVFKDIDLVIAEIEFDTVEDSRLVAVLPRWVGREITGEHDYSNVHLAKLLHKAGISGKE